MSRSKSRRKLLTTVKVQSGENVGAGVRTVSSPEAGTLSGAESISGERGPGPQRGAAIYHRHNSDLRAYKSEKKPSIRPAAFCT